MDNLKGKAIAMRYNRSVDYYIPKDLGYTLGTVYKNMQIWLKKELSHVVKFNHVYIDTTLRVVFIFFIPIHMRNHSVYTPLYLFLLRKN